MAASKAATWLPGPMQRSETKMEGVSAVIKKPRARSTKNVPEPCRSVASVADFFLPASKRKRFHREAQADAGGAGAGMEIADTEFVNSSNKKRPRKENAPPIVKEATAKQTIRVGNSSAQTVKDFPLIREPIVGLREERKLAAEEDARRSAGKPLHPFFARKIPAKSQPVKAGDSKGPFTSPKTGRLLFPCPPLHVTQYEAPEPIQLDWGKLRFVDCCKQATESCNRSEAPEALELCRQGDKAFLDLDQVIGYFSSIILSPDQLRRTRADVVATGRGVHQRYAPEQIEDQLLRYSQNASFRFQEEIADYCQASGMVLSRTRLNKRAASFKDRKLSVKVGTSAGNFLWTDVYQPRSPQDVCGNREDIRFLNDWLESWQQKILCCGRSLEKLDSFEESDGYDDKSWFQEDCSDKDASDCEEELINTLLLTGPIGCGKTAAVYACAKAQGFSVIEVSTADCRNGALIKKKFGEALESHRLQTRVAGVKCTLSDGKQPGPLEDYERSQKHESNFRTSSRNLGLDGQQLSGMSRRLTVMLFEDVDVVFDEDRGFSSALAKLAATSKRPIILTSNKRCPALPLSLVKLTREFKQPCTQTLVLHACMATAVEGSCCCPKLMECVVKACQHDMRQVMMMLQFWSQSRKDVSRDCVGLQVREGNRVAPSHAHGNDVCARGGPNQSTFTPSSQIQEINLPASRIEAQYSTVHDPLQPVLLPLSFPSSLFWHVARKVSEAAWHLHLCASFAGVIEVTTSQAEQYGTNPSDQKLTKLETEWQARNVGGDPSENIALDVGGETGLSVSVKSPGRVEALACSMKLQRPSNILSYSESQAPQPHGSQSATLETGGKSCWCKIAAEDSGGGHLCPDDRDKVAQEMIRCADAACESRSPAAEVTQSSKAKECAHNVQSSVATGKADGTSTTRSSELRNFKSSLKMCKADQTVPSLRRLHKSRDLRLCKVRDLENSQSSRHTVRKSGPRKLISAILMGCNPCVAVCEKQELSRERGSEEIQIWTESLEVAPVHAALKGSCIELPSATQDRSSPLWCDEPSALKEDKATEMGLEKNRKVAPRRRLRLCKLRDLETSQSRKDAVRKHGPTKLTSAILMGCGPCGAVQGLSRERRSEVTQITTDSREVAPVHPALKGSCVNELPSAMHEHRTPLWCGEPSALKEDRAPEIGLEEDREVAPRRRLRLCKLRDLETFQSRKDAVRKNSPTKLTSPILMGCSPCEAVCEKQELSRGGGSEVTRIRTGSLEVAVRLALKGTCVDELPSTTQESRSPLWCYEPSALKEDKATEMGLEEGRKVSFRRRLRLCKLRGLETSQSRKDAVRKNGHTKLASAILMGCSPRGAVCEKQELSRERGSEVTQIRAESLEVAPVHPALKGSCVDELPSATQEHRTRDEPSALKEGEATVATEVVEEDLGFLMNEVTVGKPQCGDIQSRTSAIAVVATMARLIDDMSLFDMISSYSACNLQASPSAEGQYGFHSELMEEEAAYLADCSVGLCLQQCSRLQELGELGTKEEHPERLQAIESGLGSLDWLGSDVNPCDADHNIRKLARKATLKNIVLNVLPKRTKALAMSAALYEYTAGLALISRLEESRQAGAAAENGRRRGRRFCHYLADSLAESDIACLLSHSEFGRGCDKSGT